MTARKVLQWPNSSLLKTSALVDNFDEDLQVVAEDLYHTMITNFGAGIAAPQVGINKQVCVISPEYAPSLEAESFRGIEGCVVLVNPTIEPMSKQGFTWSEACLSVPDITASVTRYQNILLTYQNLSGEKIEAELSGTESATVQHEADHLVGKLFIHRLKGTSRMMVMKKLRKKILSKKKPKKLQGEESPSRGKITEKKRLELRKKRRARKKLTKSKKRR